MEIFKNIVNQQKFKSTNYIWNRLRLNNPWSIGYVSNLIESKTFSSKEEWKEFYYQSGEERLRLIGNICSEEQKRALMDFTKSTQLPKELKELNLSFGRTERELDERGQYMYEQIVEEGNPLKISLAECIYMVKYRVMAETWNGIIAREHNTVKNMEAQFPGITFKKSEGERDYSYGIDYELFDNESLLCAVQIKPMSYQKGISREIIKAKKANEAKNQKYKEDYNADVLYVYSNSKGIINNQDVLEKIRAMSLKMTS